jgi:hypothetical protein
MSEPPNEVNTYLLVAYHLIFFQNDVGSG